MRPVIAHTNDQHETINKNNALTHTEITHNNNLLPHTKIANSSDNITTLYTPTVAILTHSPIKPNAPKNIMECFQPTNPHYAKWKYTAFHQYDNNASYRVFTKPQPIKSLPSNIDILKSALAPTAKPTEAENIWMLGVRYCVNGNKIKGNEKYGPTFAPTIAPDTLRFQIVYSAALGFKLQTGDCSNAFQCTHEPDAQ